MTGEGGWVGKMGQEESQGRKKPRGERGAAHWEPASRGRSNWQTTALMQSVASGMAPDAGLGQEWGRGV